MSSCTLTWSNSSGKKSNVLQKHNIYDKCSSAFFQCSRICSLASIGKAAKKYGWNINEQSILIALSTLKVKTFQIQRQKRKQEAKQRKHAKWLRKQQMHKILSGAQEQFLVTTVYKTTSITNSRDIIENARVECLHTNNPLAGQDKWLGGELSHRNGCLYGVPGSAKTILKIDPGNYPGSAISTTGPKISLIPLPPKAKSSLSNGRFKWLRGIEAKDGCIYAIPSNALQVLRIDPALNIQEKNGTDQVKTFGGPWQGTWKWHGGVLAADGAIYCIPCNATRVLKIIPGKKPIAKLIGPELPGRNKWYGGLLGSDGAIYGIPNCSETILRIEPDSHDVDAGISTFGQVEAGFGKWHGGVTAADGSIICFPAFASRVLRIVPDTKTVEEIGPQLVEVAKEYRGDTRYKYGGGVLGPDLAVYAFPSDADHPLRIIPHLKSVEVLNLHGKIDDSNNMKVTAPSPLVKTHNKWQNGFVGDDGSVYAIPCNAPAVLRIKVPDESCGRSRCIVELIGMDMIEHGCALEKGNTIKISGEKINVDPESASAAKMHDKWEGGVVGLDGALYCMPQNSKFVLKVNA